MANWQRELDLRDLWDSYNEGETSIQNVAKEIAVRLKALAPLTGGSLLEIEATKDLVVEEFEAASEDLTLTTDGFDSIMMRLYDWADLLVAPAERGKMTKRVCWIRTEI